MEEKRREPLTPEDDIKWYYRFWVIVLAFLAGGPLALILVWFRPRTGLLVKILVTILVCAFTVVTTKASVDYYRGMVAHIEEVARAVNP